MALLYQRNGCLIPGIHEISWEEFVNEFGFNKKRLTLIAGLQKAIRHLRDVGCTTAWIDGSFTTKEINPNDFDGCWDPRGVDLNSLKNKYPALFFIVHGTKSQKDLYGGELYPSPKFLDFFQNDRDNNPKGIVKLNI
jgi:hypothetical protein